MAVTFLEPSGDADFLVGTTNGFWSFSSGGIATDYVHGNHIKSISYIGGGGKAVRTPSSVVSDSGARISAYFYFVAFPGSDSDFIFIDNVTPSGILSVKISSTGILRLYSNGSQRGTDGLTLSTGQWYRISLAYTITSTTVNRFELFVDGTSTISLSNTTLPRVSSSIIGFGNQNGNTSFSIRSSDHYIDNSSSLTDTGNIWVTAKRPVSNGTTNGFTTQIGSGGSGYGTGHSPQVNERPLSTTNGWAMVGAGSAITEEYNIEAKNVGDIDISAATIVDWLGWASMKSLVGETVSIILNGATVSQAITSTITLYTKIKGSSTYPSGSGADIGIITDTSLTTVSLYECGVVVAYIPTTSTVYTMVTAPASFAFTPQSSTDPVKRMIATSPASFVFTAMSSAFKTVRKLVTAPASFVFTAMSSAFKTVRKLVTAPASFVFTAMSAGFKRIINIATTPATFLLTGMSSGFKRVMTLITSNATYILTGMSAGFKRVINMVTSPATYILTGMSSGFKKIIIMITASATFIFTGIASSIIPKIKYVYTMITAPAQFIVTGMQSGLNKVGQEITSIWTRYIALKKIK